MFAMMLCNPDEYENDGECCPMCRAGHRVLKHCNKYSATQCKVCTESTYTDVPNNITACLTCTECDEVKGLREKKKCTFDSDAVCEPLSRYYCIETHIKSCRKAREHSICRPGQYIYQTGTSSMDTVCKDCPEETYSDGSFKHCVNHTDCESMGQITFTSGTWSSDAVCSSKTFYLVIIGVGITLTLTLILFVWVSVVLQKKKKKIIILSRPSAILNTSV